MAKKKQTTGGAPLEAPNAGELDVYSVLFAERGGEGRPLQLSEVFRRGCAGRGLAAAYPDRLDALLDFARALELSEQAMRQLQELIAAERARGGGPATP